MVPAHSVLINVGEENQEDYLIRRLIFFLCQVTISNLM